MTRTIFTLMLISALFAQCSKSSDPSGGISTTGAGGSLARFAIVGNYLYTVDDQKLKVYDIANAADPVLKSTVNIGIEIETIYPFKDKLFIGSTSAVHIISIADPLKPERLATAISPQVLRRCDPVVAKDSVAYATLRTNGPCGGFRSILAVYDISNVTNPIQKMSVEVGEPYGLGYAKNVLYVCDKRQGLILLDIEKPYLPEFIKSLHDGSYTDVICYDNTLICWVNDGVILYDITDNKNPMLLAKIN